MDPAFYTTRRAETTEAIKMCREYLDGAPGFTDVKVVAAAEAALVAAEATLEDARKDSERLETLVSEGYLHHLVRFPDDSWAFLLDDDVQYSGGTWRDAIDNAFATPTHEPEDDHA